MRSRIGLTLMVVAALFYGSTNICIKLGSPYLSACQTAMGRFLLGAAFMPVLARLLRVPPGARERGLLIYRGISGTIGFLLLIQAMKTIPLSVAMVLFYLWPVFGCLLSSWVAGEPTPKREWPLVVCALLGAAVVLWPEKGGPGLNIGHFLALAASFFSGHAVILIRRLRRQNDAVTIYFYQCVTGGLIAMVPLLAQAGPILPVTGEAWLYLSMVAVFSMIGQVLMNEGMKYLGASRTGSLMMIEVIVAATFGPLFLGESVTIRFVLGTILILGSGAVLIAMPPRASVPASSE